MWNPHQRLRSHSTWHYYHIEQGRSSGYALAFRPFECGCAPGHAELSENRFGWARQVVERLSELFLGNPARSVAPPTSCAGVAGIRRSRLRASRDFRGTAFRAARNRKPDQARGARRVSCTRKGLVERSATNADYSPVGLLSAPWAQYGTLAEAYPASTLAVDDTQGLLYRPYKEDPAFGPVSRSDLFGARRMALVGDELMLFQTVVLEGSETTRLSGVVRGYMNTPVQAHASGAAIWVFRNPGEGNTVQGLPIGTHNIKLRPVSGDEVLGADRVDRLSLAVTGKAMVPWPVAGLRAVRTGDSVAVSWSRWTLLSAGPGRAPRTRTSRCPPDSPGISSLRRRVRSMWSTARPSPLRARDASRCP
ncbi:MAG: hypothetical protein ACLT2T_05170 [Bilophila wadsworthia]